MSYLKDYLYYCSGTEVPEDYTWWAALSILGHILGNKVWLVHGDYFRFHPNIYVCLVGDAGSGKNTGLSVNMEVMLEHFEGLMLSASIQSREDVADLMASDECARIWTDKAGYLKVPGKSYDYRPFYILNNELASFLSVDRTKMVEFLVEVFDGKRFGVGFKRDRREDPGKKKWFNNPHVSLLVGAVPTFFMGALKVDLFTGGLGRRLIIVSANRTKTCPEPKKPFGADEALARCVEHLKKAYFFYGPMERDAGAWKWWNEWYTENRNKKPDDPILGQFHETEHMMLLKVAMLLKAAESLDSRVIEARHLEAAKALLDSLKGPVLKLTSGVGRNELAGVGAEMLSVIEGFGGAILEKKLQGLMYRNIPNGIRGWTELLKHLQDTGQIVGVAPVTGDWAGRVVIMTKARHELYVKTGT